MSFPGKSLFLQRKHWSRNFAAASWKGECWERETTLTEEEEEECLLLLMLLLLSMVVLLITCGVFLLTLPFCASNTTLKPTIFHSMFYSIPFFLSLVSKHSRSKRKRKEETMKLERREERVRGVIVVGPLQLWSSKTKINDLTAFSIQLPRISLLQLPFLHFFWFFFLASISFIGFVG